MSEAIETTPKTAPWHLWLVGIVGVFWNGFGGYDYTMSKLGGDEYLRAFGMTEAQIAYYNAMPAWMTAAWAIGVWGAVLGTILLLLRRKEAVAVFVISFAAFLASLVYQYGLTDGAGIMGAESAIMSGVITAGCLFFIWYAWTMTKRGVLR